MLINFVCSGSELQIAMGAENDRERGLLAGLSTATLEQWKWRVVKKHVGQMSFFFRGSSLRGLAKRRDRRLKYLGRAVEELKLSNRVVKRLRERNVQTIRDLAACSTFQLLSMPGFGRKSVEQVQNSLRNVGLSLYTRFDQDGRITWPPLTQFKDP